MCANGGQLWTDRRVADRRPHPTADSARTGPSTFPQILSTAVWRTSICPGQAVDEAVEPVGNQARSVVSWRVPARSGMENFAARPGAKDTRVTFLRAFQPKLSTGAPRPCGYCEATGLAHASMPSAAIQRPQVLSRDPRLHGPGELGRDAGGPRVRPGVAVDLQRRLVIVRARDHEPFHT